MVGAMAWTTKRPEKKMVVMASGAMVLTTRRMGFPLMTGNSWGVAEVPPSVYTWVVWMA